MYNVREHAGTWYVVALGLNASREVGVFRDRMAVVIQRRELTWDFCVSGYQHWWEYCIMDINTGTRSSLEHSNSDWFHVWIK